MNAAIAVFSHGKLPLLCIARQPGLLHTGLRVLLASKARHYTVCVLEPWAADLPFGVEIPPNLLFGRLGGHFGPGRARLADHLHTIGHVPCTCGMHAVHTCLACPRVPTGRFIAHTAHTFKTVATLRAQGVHLVLAIGARGDVPMQFVATTSTRG